MAEGDDIIRATEQHLMVAHDAAAAHGADADLLRVALLADSGTVINIVVCAVVLFVDGVSQHQSRAAGSVQFVVMVLLNDLDVVVCAQNGRCTFAQLGQDVDAHGHRTYGFGYKRINDIFVESQHIWEDYAGDGAGMVKKCEEETGVTVCSPEEAQRLMEMQNGM